MATHSKTDRHITLLASLGSTLEYYDFVVYGMMAAYLSAAFFPSQNQTAAVLQSFLVFAVGYFARPLGGTVIGIIGDRWGRRPAFLISTTLMASSTLLIALLPNYETWGEIAVLLLVLFRIIQGISFGGELPGAMTIVGEFSSENRRGRKTSLVIASMNLGALLASGVLYLLASTLSKEEIVSWGWRLPFLAGGILGILLLIARNTVQETPVFQSIQERSKNHKPLMVLLGNHKFSLLKGAALTAFMAALTITNLYLPYYLPKFFGYESKDVYFATTLSFIFSVLVLPLAGMYADLFRHKTTLLRWTCASYIVLSLPIFLLLSTGTMLFLVTFLMIQQLFIALFVSTFFPILIRIFSPEVRYTGIAFCYNLTWAIMATLPMGLTAILDFFANPWVVPLTLSVIAGLSLVATWGTKEAILDVTNNRDEENVVKLERVG
ncbi:MFS transporter [Candidatus Odyssella acanthamoebae]|uniref:Major facilitator superfamily (MFS) profile domain-containing protein n=1 Tax=Candidatus Odyssella acanthamoebae TaxID=91604 RepID=A0A077AUB6_9PROT|nr:MFS transporter [Candidatus Paracaedibacter acanthamoebae]AIK95619.1 hypothetical protein ID47_00915 [Candidatus Paracaedibacter acanthamoebae]